MDVGKFPKKFLSFVSFLSYFQILSCSTFLQFARVSVPLEALVTGSLIGFPKEFTMILIKLDTIVGYHLTLLIKYILQDRSNL